MSNNRVGRKDTTLHIVHSSNGKITGCLDEEKNIYLLNIDLIRCLKQEERTHERKQHKKIP